MARPRAADDFEAIRMRMNELRRERAQVSTSDEKLRTDQRQARSDGHGGRAAARRDRLIEAPVHRVTFRAPAGIPG